MLTNIITKVFFVQFNSEEDNCWTFEDEAKPHSISNIVDAETTPNGSLHIISSTINLLIVLLNFLEHLNCL